VDEVGRRCAFSARKRRPASLPPWEEPRMRPQRKPEIVERVRRCSNDILRRSEERRVRTEVASVGAKVGGVEGEVVAISVCIVEEIMAM
jgi:hypothetical protein